MVWCRARPRSEGRARRGRAGRGRTPGTPVPAGPRTRPTRRAGVAPRGRAGSCGSGSSGHASIRGRGDGVSRSRLRSRAIAAQHALGVGELAPGQNEEARGAEELARASGSDAGLTVAPFVDVGLLLFLVLLLVLEGGARRPLLQEDVERLLDVVGVELLVEVDDVLFLVARLGGRFRGLGDDHLGGLAFGVVLGVVLGLVVVERDVVVEVFVLQVFVLELVLVEGLLVELGFRLVEVVVAHRCSAPRGACPKGRTPPRLACRRRPGAVGPRSITPRPRSAAQRVGRLAHSRAGVAESGQKEGPRRPLGPLFGPHCPGSEVIPSFSAWSPGPPTPCTAPSDELRGIATGRPTTGITAQG